MIKIERLRAVIDGAVIIDGLTLDIPDGICCVSGRSGCGKTTLLRCIAGLMPYEGAVHAPGHPTVMFQEDRLLPWLTATQNVETVLPRGEKSNARVWLEAAGLAGDMDKYPSELSGGMRRRAALARALAYGRDFMLLDEPFTGLDAATRADMMRIIKENVKNAVIITHDEDAENIADTCLICDGPPLTAELCLQTPILLPEDET